jgi:hypothetical protein
MKRIIITTIAIMICLSSYGRVKLFLGLRGGAGVMLTHEQMNSLFTSQGARNAFVYNKTYSIHAKAEALLGFGHFRIGYRFLYNFSGPDVSGGASYFANDNNRATTYYNNSQTHFFGHYLVLEYALINLPHFSLTPGICGGTFTGFKVDNTTGNDVGIATDTHHRFTLGAELNAEIHFGQFSILAGPNYYLFSLQDRSNSDWREYEHFIGGDVGFRVNLIKAKK